MLSFAVRRIAAAVPAIALSALLAAVTAEAAGRGWPDALAEVAAALPVTAGLVLPALLAGGTLGSLFGLSAGLNPRSASGWLGGLLGSLGPALPGFLLAAVLATVVTGGPGALALAWTALSVPPAAQAARLARGALDGILGGGAVLAAQGRGLDSRAVLWRHAVPMALSPVAGAFRTASATAVTGAVAVEGLFGLPGAGGVFLKGAHAADAATAVTGLAGLCVLLALANALGAVLHGWIDPRFRMA